MISKNSHHVAVLCCHYCRAFTTCSMYVYVCVYIISCSYYHDTLADWSAVEKKMTVKGRECQILLIISTLRLSGECLLTKNKGKCRPENQGIGAS